MIAQGTVQRASEHTEDWITPLPQLQATVRYSAGYDAATTGRMAPADTDGRCILLTSPHFEIQVASRCSSFILHCHLNKTEAGAAEISAFLETSGIANHFDAKELIDRSSSHSAAGRDLLARYDAQRSAAMA